MLLFVCGHYTSWHKRATKLLDETLTVANETQGDLVSDMVYFSADGGADLAESYAVPPAGAVENKSSGLNLHNECTAVKMAPGEPAPDFELLSHDHAQIRTHDL